MIVYPVFVLYFGFCAWSMYMAWAHTERFQRMIDGDPENMTLRHAFSFTVMTALCVGSTWGIIYSWFQQ